MYISFDYPVDQKKLVHGQQRKLLNIYNLSQLGQKHIQQNGKPLFMYLFVSLFYENVLTLLLHLQKAAAVLNPPCSFFSLLKASKYNGIDCADMKNRLLQSQQFYHKLTDDTVRSSLCNKHSSINFSFSLPSKTALLSKDSHMFAYMNA